MFHLDTVDATGVKSVNFTLPSFLPVGYTFVAQVKIVNSDLSLRRT